VICYLLDPCNITGRTKNMDCQNPRSLRSHSPLDQMVINVHCCCINIAKNRLDVIPCQNMRGCRKRKRGSDDLPERRRLRQATIRAIVPLLKRERHGTFRRSLNLLSRRLCWTTMIRQPLRAPDVLEFFTKTLKVGQQRVALYKLLLRKAYSSACFGHPRHSF